MNILLAVPFTLSLLTFTLFCGFILDVIGTIVIATYDEIRLRLRQKRNGIRLVRIPGMARRWRT